MANSYFKFKQFTVQQDECAMKVTTDACLFGAWSAEEVQKEPVSNARALDIGTGTGVVSLLLAQKNPALQINAVEIDVKACKQAEQNFDTSPFSNTIQAYCSDIKDSTFPYLFKYIICNPPFYQQSLKASSLQKNLALHSTALELHEVITIIKNYLLPDGNFFLLLPFQRHIEVLNLIASNGLFVHKKVFVKQNIKHSYFRILLKGGLQGGHSITEASMSITDENKEYTQEFKYLLKDYYLNL